MKNIYILQDENQRVEMVCDSKEAAEKYIDLTSALGELDYMEAEVWNLSDVECCTNSKEWKFKMGVA